MCCTATEGNQTKTLRSEGCQYHYNLNSSTLETGTYRIDILIGGQVVGSAYLPTEMTFALRIPEKICESQSQPRGLLRARILQHQDRSGGSGGNALL